MRAVSHFFRFSQPVAWSVGPPPFSVLPAMGASRLDGVLWILGLLWAFRVSAESQEKHEMTEDRVPKLRHNYIELHS